MMGPDKFLPLLAILALFAGGLSCAGEPPEKDPDSRIVAEEKSADGYLDEMWVAPSWDREAFAGRFDKHPVLLREYLPYPNPLSSPAVIVAVDRQADFRLEVKDVSSRKSDEFAFTDVEAGFYRFFLVGNHPYESRFIVTLWCGDDQVAEISYRQSALSPGR